MEFKDYSFEAKFIDAEETDCTFIVPITVSATSYEQARALALTQAQNIVRANDSGYRTLFMRVEKA